jgi:hypothetical protein
MATQLISCSDCGTKNASTRSTCLCCKASLVNIVAANGAKGWLQTGQKLLSNLLTPTDVSAGRALMGGVEALSDAKETLASPELLAHLLYSVTSRHVLGIVNALKQEPPASQALAVMQEVLIFYYSVFLLTMGNKFPEMYRLIGQRGMDYPSLFLQESFKVGLKYESLPIEFKDWLSDEVQFRHVFDDAYRFYYHDQSAPNVAALDQIARMCTSYTSAVEARQANPVVYLAMKIHCRIGNVLKIDPREIERFLSLWICQVILLTEVVKIVSKVRPII